MFYTNEIPSPSSLFSAYASVATSIVLFRSVTNELIPHPIRGYLLSALCYFFKHRSQLLTLTIDEFDGISRNQVFDAAETYLCTKISPNTERLKVCKTPKDKKLTIKLEKDEKIVENYEGVELTWRFVCVEAEKNDPYGRFPSRSEKRFFELSFLKKHKDMMLNSYIPFMVGSAKKVKEEHRVLKMHSLSNSHHLYGGIRWDSINLEHPATFDTLAMEPDLKNALIEDLKRFLKRKKFYERVGRAWKRGYLLFGPPGTGKSSLVAAMANYLRFDVYDLQLVNIRNDSDLRTLLLATSNRSILVIEDVDCSVDLPDRHHEEGHKQHDPHLQLTLSGLLNFIDGLWSSCGEERIIVFTTNHKEKLDPALLRPGRMDMHIHMSYCTFHGFKILAANYLEINGYHRLFEEIEDLMKSTDVTPAQVAEELMTSEDADVALEGLVKLLKRKNVEANEPQVDEAGNRIGTRQRKRQKIEKKPKRPINSTRRKITRSRCYKK